MEAIKGLWLFMVGLLADDMLSMVFRKFRLWKDTIWADGYTKGHDDTQNHFNEIRKYEIPLDKYRPMPEDVKAAYQHGLTDMQNIYHDREAAQPTDEYNRGFLEGHSIGYGKGLAEPRTNKDEYNEGYKMGASVGYSHGLAEPRNPVVEDMNIAAKHYENGYNTGYDTGYLAGVSDAENKNGNRMDMLNQDVIAWAMRTFPAQTSETIAKHLLREAMDLYHNVQHNEDAGMAPMNNDDDIADVYILLITLAAECNVDLYYAVDNKNNINKGRQWVYLPDKGYHVHTNSIDARHPDLDNLDTGGFEILHG